MAIKKLNIGARLGLGFGFLSVALVFMVGQSTIMLGRVNEGTSEIVDKRMPRIEMAATTLRETNDIAIALRNMMLDDSADDRRKQVEEILSSRKATEDTLAQMDKSLNNPKARAVLAEQVEMNARYVQGQKDLMALIESGDDAGARAYLKTKLRPVLGAYKAAIGKQIELQSELAGAAARTAQTVYEETRILMIVLGIVILAVACALAWWIAVSITRPLRRALDLATAVAAGDLTARVEVDSACEVGQLLDALTRMNDNLVATVGTVRTGTEAISLASGEVAAGNRDLSARTEQQASALEETASSMEELTSTVKQNADNARQANTLAATASGVAERGGAVIEQVVDTMGQIHTASGRITDIIGVIDGIAFQTNILALNAAVEAARAGEQGRGFAVVAGEVRNLAHRSAAAAKEIKSLIDDSSGKVEAGSALVREAGSTMHEIVDSVRRVTDILGEITSASQEQSAGIEQINQAITQMDDVTQQNAALVEQAAAASQAMRDQAERLAAAVAVFRLEAGAAATAASTAVTTAPAAPTRALAAPSRPAAASRPVTPAAAARPAAAKPAATKAAIAKPAASKPAARAAALDSDWEEF
jgi:methyl-accepting chemotaxis protein